MGGRVRGEAGEVQDVDGNGIAIVIPGVYHGTYSFLAYSLFYIEGQTCGQNLLH